MCVIDGTEVTGGGAVALEQPGVVSIKGSGDSSEIIVFDLA
jgi:hypothetical protein